MGENAGSSANSSAEEQIQAILVPDRSEITESQKVRSDLLKWKLIAVAVLGSVGLGLTERSAANSYSLYVLAVIPFVAVYVDVLCHHLNLRMLVISAYARIRCSGCDLVYEDFCKQARSLDQCKHSRRARSPEKGCIDTFGLERVALKHTTVALCGFLVVLALVLIPGWPPCGLWDWLPSIVILSAAIAGVVVSHLTDRAFRIRYRALKALEKSYLAKAPLVQPPGQNEPDDARRDIPDGLTHAPSRIRSLLSSSYSLREIREIDDQLQSRGTFVLQPYSSGLFPAVGPGSATERTSGYRSVWVRDNVHIAYAHFAGGNTPVAVRTTYAIASFYLKYRHRFTDVIAGRVDPSDPMVRPHVRFDGERLEEIAEKWPHAQNDALGYFLWLFCRLALAGVLVPTEEQIALLADMVRYLDTIRFWCDEDSGHWEEQRKVSASSIGVVNAALRAYQTLFEQCPYALRENATADRVKRMIADATQALDAILPAECAQVDPRKQRRYDAGLLFLVEPLAVVEPAMANRILSDVTSKLLGEHGISRYPGDSYWGPDYRRKVPESKRTCDFSDSMEHRDSLASVPGMEAQWCIFDPILSIIHGRRYQRDGRRRSLDLQTRHLNRSLSQLIERSREGKHLLLCPEAYFAEEGNWVANDHIPLLWTQANLWRAMSEMIRSLSLA